MRARRGLRALVLTVVATVGLAGCDKPVDLTKALQIEEVSSGWHDAGMVEGKNKLVPVVTFKVKNVSDQALNVLQMNVLFRRVSEEATEWGSGFVTVAGSSGLKAGASSDPLTVTSQLGYTGTEARAEMMQNSQFVDAKVQLFAKYASTQWVKIGEYPVTRTLLSK
ncbi:MAG TPA: hypothetical protein VH417_04460 [Vicinamibacterales bacterium]|jgi:hypothetical protein